MNRSHYQTYLSTANRQKGFITSSVLILVAFASVFFPRIINAVGFPAPINFVHLIVVPVACCIIICTSKAKDVRQLAIVTTMLTGMLWLLVVTTASALINTAGWINIFLGLILWLEPFIFLAAIVSLPLTAQSLSLVRRWVIGFALVHLILAFGQKFALDLGVLAHTRLTIEDNVQGVFYLSSGGHVVAAAVSIIFGLYYFISAKNAPLWLRGLIMFAVGVQIIFADAKQMVLITFIAWILLAISRTKDIRKTFQYLISALIAGYAFYWCIYNVELFSPYRGWIRPEIYMPNGDATLLKTAPLSIIPAHYTSPFNWLLGLGPGHTIGRIGGWMIRDYGHIFDPLGATTHPVTEKIWNTWNVSYLDSSFFSPFWGWAGVWGDIGFLGLASFIWLWVIVWIHLCKDDFSRFLLINIAVNGFIFTLMEEPGYTLTSMLLIGLRWHELRLQSQTRQTRSFSNYLPVKQLKSLGGEKDLQS